MKKCIVFAPTNICINVINDPEDTYTPPDGYYVPNDDTGEIYDYWTGVNWYKPRDILINAHLDGYPTVNTPDLNDESQVIPNTFWVRREIQDFVFNQFLPTFILDGGSFSEIYSGATYDAGYFDDTGENLTADLVSPVFDDTGGNLTTNIDAGTY